MRAEHFRSSGMSLPFKRDRGTGYDMDPKPLQGLYPISLILHNCLPDLHSTKIRDGE